MAKHLDKIEQLFEKSPVVLYSDVDRVVRSKKKTNYAKQLLNSLVKNRKINRITRGCYTKHNETGLGVLCFKPAYLGLQSALSYHGLWEQETIPVIITSCPVRQGIRVCMNSNILIRRTAPKYLFGYHYVDDSGHYLPYSDVEKTLIDFYAFREKLSPATIAAFKEKIDLKRLNKYLLAYPERIRVKVQNAIINH